MIPLKKTPPPSLATDIAHKWRVSLFWALWLGRKNLEKGRPKSQEKSHSSAPILFLDYEEFHY